MKKNYAVLLLAMLGFVGCSDERYRSANMDIPELDPKEQNDTALVLGNVHCGNNFVDRARFLLVKKDGGLVRVAHSSRDNNVGIYDFSNVGDTVIVGTNANGTARIVKNLTMENKIKTFSKQR